MNSIVGMIWVTSKGWKGFLPFGVILCFLLEGDPIKIPIVVFFVGPLSSPNESTWGLGLWGCCYFYVCQFSFNVATLILGSWPRQGLVKVRAKSEAWSHVSCSWECGRMWWNEPPHSQVSSHFGSCSHFASWSLDGLPNFQKVITRVDSLDWRVFYIIGKLLQCRCLKWDCMTHLGTWNTSYGQKKG